jgi:hypothetical protein
MAIQMTDIVSAMQGYRSKISTQVVITPATGPSINVGEKFFVSVTITNATAATGGVSLGNIRFYFQTGDPQMALLIAPPTSSGLLVTNVDTKDGAPIPAGQEVHFLVLFINHQPYVLHPGESVTLPDIQGVAKKPNASPRGIDCTAVYEFSAVTFDQQAGGGTPLKIT